MHARGRHLNVQRNTDTIYDADFDVDAQSYALMSPPVAIGSGEQLRIECSYENPSPTTLHFGPFASDEMCYAMLVRYPALDDDPYCLD
jgi:hypothetical protein